MKKQMKNQILKFAALVLCLSSYANAQAASAPLHTEDNELVCQLSDLMETKIFVDSDRDLDGKIGVLSSKILEMPTKNAYAYNFRLFQVELVSVSRPRCLGCQDTQVILYKTEDESSIINKLEVTNRQIKITRNVNVKGEPLEPSFVDEGPCEANEVP